jgi:hypothetical protein
MHAELNVRFELSIDEDVLDCDGQNRYQQDIAVLTERTVSVLNERHGARRY